MLYCKACNFVVGAGQNSCGNCGNGFVSALMCGGCGKEVARGASSCSTCDRHVGGVGLVPQARPPLPGPPPPGVALTILPFGAEAPPGGGAPPPFGALAIPGLPLGLPVPVRSSYTQERFGVVAEVEMNGRDADILTKMQQAAALLHVLAKEMNNLQGHMPSTREVIKGCRKLALEIQEEVEVRLGPQGGISG